MAQSNSDSLEGASQPEVTQSAKRLRIDAPAGPSCYNVFCKELGANEEDIKTLPPRERFRVYSDRWFALDGDERESYSTKAAEMKLSSADIEKKWKKNLKKIIKLIHYQQQLKPSTQGFFLMSDGPGDSQFGGTVPGVEFLLGACGGSIVEKFEQSSSLWTDDRVGPTINAKQIRELFNAKYADAVGKKGQRFPYKDLDGIYMEGLPDGIPLRRPAQYGCRQLRAIWVARHNLRCVVSAGPAKQN